MKETEIKLWVWLAECRCVGSRLARRLLEHFGSIEAVYRATESEYRSVPGIGSRAVSSLTEKRLNEVERILLLCRKKGICVMAYHDEDYPKAWRYIDDPPMVVYYRGRVPELDEAPVIGVVGSRKHSAYGEQQALMFGANLSRTGCIVASGGARGIDSMALSGAILTGEPCICILGCGVDVVYPPENDQLFFDVTRNGWLVSEYPPGTKPLSGNFPRRNRLISGLAVGLLVVEAREHSGALITVNHALEQGKDVFAVPGEELCSANLGSEKLLQEGAFMAESAWDIAREYAELYPKRLRRLDSDTPFPELRATPSQRICTAANNTALREQSSDSTADVDRYLQNRAEDRRDLEQRAQQQKQLWNARRRERKQSPERENTEKAQQSPKKILDNPGNGNYSDVQETLKLSASERQMLELLASGPCQIDDLVERSGKTSGQVLAALTMLQMKKLVSQKPGKIYESQIRIE